MTQEEKLLHGIFGNPPETAPKVTCGWCGWDFYLGVGDEFVLCPECKTKWEIAKWYKPPEKGSERWLKYHKIK